MNISNFQPTPYLHFPKNASNEMNIQLRPSVESDIEIFFNNQLDEEANYMAAFTPKDPTDKEAYMRKFKRLLGDRTINMKTILYNNEIAGTVSKFEIDGKAEITSQCTMINYQ